MGKHDTQEIISHVVEAGMEKAKELGVDGKEDDFVIIQQLDGGQGVVINVEDNDEGNRAFKIQVTDSLIVLDKIDGTLDIYEGGE